MANLNSRTRIELRWSTDPKHVGYAEPHQIGKDLLQDRTADFVGTPRQVLAEVARVRNNVGQGTYMAVQFRAVTSRQEITEDELTTLVFGY
jgi:hypothetical protein